MLQPALVADRYVEFIQGILDETWQHIFDNKDFFNCNPETVDPNVLIKQYLGHLDFMVHIEI